MKVVAHLIEGDMLIEEREFDDAQDALRWLWGAAEQAPHDAGALRVSIDGNEILL